MVDRTAYIFHVVSLLNCQATNVVCSEKHFLNFSFIVFFHNFMIWSSLLHQKSSCHWIQDKTRCYHLFILSEFVILMLLVGFCFAVKFKWSIMLGAFIHPFSGKLRCTWRGLLENFINLQKVVATGAEWMFLVHSAEWADDSDTLPQAWLTVAA